MSVIIDRGYCRLERSGDVFFHLNYATIVTRFLVGILPLVSWYLVKARICHLFIDILDKSWHTLHVMSRDLISIRCTIGHNFGSVLANYVIMTKKLFVHISYSR